MLLHELANGYDEENFKIDEVITVIEQTAPHAEMIV